MPKAEIEELGKLLVQQVRDAAIRSCDQLLQPGAGSPKAMRWREAMASKCAEWPAVTIPDCVDEALFFLLNAIDQGLLPLALVTKDGKTVNLAEEGLGELAGWYMMSGGWRADYSTERFVDDFADLV